jgi:hypothetical protein
MWRASCPKSKLLKIKKDVTQKKALRMRLRRTKHRQNDENEKEEKRVGGRVR